MVMISKAEIDRKIKRMGNEAVSLRKSLDVRRNYKYFERSQRKILVLLNKAKVVNVWNDNEYKWEQERKKRARK